MSEHQRQASAAFHDRVLGCLLGGVIGDAMGTPTEGLGAAQIRAQYGWVDTLTGDGTDDTVMRDLLIEALVRTDGFATLDDWAQVWLDHWEAIFGPKQAKFFVSVLHTAQKLKSHAVPRMAALGNMPSSSSAMCIAPVGLVNAGDPAAAAAQAYNLANLIHTHDVGYCQDGAAAIAAAVAAAFTTATPAEVIDAALRALLPSSGHEMRQRIETASALAREAGDYAAFVGAVYRDPDRFFCRIMCDARETVPLALSVLLLADGQVAQAVVYAANLGRDADTIGAMAGAIAGAMRGASSIPARLAGALPNATQERQVQLADQLCEVAMSKHRMIEQRLTAFQDLSS